MKTTLLLILMACSLSANAVEFRQRTEVVAGSSPTYPECNRIYTIVERFDSGFWVTESITLVQDTCTEALFPMNELFKDTEAQWADRWITVIVK
jgi:hypothetical protein